MASYYKVVQEEVHTVWPVIERWLHEALLGDITIHTNDIKPHCISGLLELFLISDDERIAGFFIGRVMQNPRGKYYYAAFFGGENVMSWLKWSYGELKKHALAEGCVQLNIIGPRSWQRLLDIKPKAVYYTIKL